ncbi:hypothetical protein QTP86_000728 [Hemibagrus guttatus]|nr:hypothetical protein QTP86_000728 [Hemibagrus guttatus]
MFYRGTIESVLSSYITAWFGNCTVSDHKTLQLIVRTAGKISGVSLPSNTDMYTTHCICKANSIVDDPTHPSHTLFTLLETGESLCKKELLKRSNVSTELQSDVLLPCNFDPALLGSDKTADIAVVWKQMNTTRHGLLEISLRGEASFWNSKDGRIKHFPKLSESGNFSILLQKVQPYDLSLYTCELFNGTSCSIGYQEVELQSNQQSNCPYDNPIYDSYHNTAQTRHGSDGKGRELADMMERRKVDILCVQETRWKGSKACSIGGGFKLFYYGVDSKRNGVGVVLKEEFVRNVLEVKRVSDRVMGLKLEIEGMMLNFVSGYAPQVGCELEEKERFWSELDEVMESIPTGERVVIGADFNGYVGEGKRGDEEVMGKFGVKERNLEGQMVVDFAKRMDMAVVNTYFQKKEEHRVTYKSGNRSTQVDYILCRRSNLKEISDCKVVVGEIVARQHRMVVCRMTLIVCKKKRSEVRGENQVVEAEKGGML